MRLGHPLPMELQTGCVQAGAGAELGADGVRGADDVVGVEDEGFVLGGGARAAAEGEAEIVQPAGPVDRHDHVKGFAFGGGGGGAFGVDGGTIVGGEDKGGVADEEGGVELAEEGVWEVGVVEWGVGGWVAVGGGNLEFPFGLTDGVAPPGEAGMLGWVGHEVGVFLDEECLVCSLRLLDVGLELIEAVLIKEFNFLFFSLGPLIDQLGM